MALVHKLKHYATLYGVSYDTIKAWKKKGYPLDDEPATRALVATHRNTGANFTAPANTTAPRTARNVESGALGLAASIQRLRLAERDAHADYETADATTKGWRLKEWLELSEALRKVEKDNPDIEAANNEAVRIADVSLELAALFRNLRSDLDGLGKRLSAELVGLDALGIKEGIDRETGIIINGLFESKYLRGGDE